MSDHLLREAEICHVSIRLANLSMTNFLNHISEQEIDKNQALVLAECLASLRNHIDDIEDNFTDISKEYAKQVLQGMT